MSNRDKITPALAGAVPNDVAVKVGDEIEQALEKVPADHRAGFLFGMLVGILAGQGMSETQVRGEIVKGLNLIYTDSSIGNAGNGIGSKS